MYFTATTELEFDPARPNEEAGMILLNNGSHFDLLDQAGQRQASRGQQAPIRIRRP